MQSEQPAFDKDSANCNYLLSEQPALDKDPTNCNYLQSEQLPFDRDPQLNDGDDTSSERVMGGTGDVHLTLWGELGGDSSGEVNTAEKLSSSSPSSSDDDIGTCEDAVEGGGEGKVRTGALNKWWNRLAEKQLWRLLE